jgi:Ca2+-binding EF-hand superfamily protein
MEMMQKVGLEDGDGSISRAEFILLMAVRLDAIRAPILEFIRKRFDELDVDNSGDLSYAELQVVTIYLIGVYHLHLYQMTVTL